MLFIYIIALYFISNVFVPAFAATTDAAFAGRCSPREAISGLSYRKLDNDGAYEIRTTCRSLVPNGLQQIAESDLVCEDSNEIALNAVTKNGEGYSSISCGEDKYARGHTGSIGPFGTTIQFNCCNSPNLMDDNQLQCYTIGPIDMFGQTPVKQIKSATLDNPKCQQDVLKAMTISEKGMELQFCSMFLVGNTYDSACKEQHDAKVADIQQYNGIPLTINNIQPNNNFNTFKRVQRNEETVQGESYMFECPKEQAVNKVEMEQRKINDGTQDLIFKMNCQNVLHMKQVAIRKRITKFTLPLSVSTMSAQCRNDETLCGIISDFNSGKRIYALICCELSNAVVASRVLSIVRNVTSDYMSQTENTIKTDVMKNIVIQKTSQGLFVTSYFATYQSISKPKFFKTETINNAQSMPDNIKETTEIQDQITDVRVTNALPTDVRKLN